MNLNDFINEIVDIISDKIEEDEDVVRYDAIKNNNTKLHGVVIKKLGESVSPTIYLEGYYDRYLRESNLECIADEIIKTSRKHRDDLKVDVSDFEKFEAVKGELFVKLINRECNKELLENVPYKEFLDLAIVAYFDASRWCGLNASVLIKNEHIKMWEIDSEEVIELAIKNSYIKNGFSITNILDLFDVEVVNYCSTYPMYVLTNKTKYFGAACMIYEDVINEFCEQNDSDVYIIPSSIHEVIIVLVNDEISVDCLNEMIRSVNETELDNEDILSNHGYIYRRGSGYEMI